MSLDAARSIQDLLGAYQDTVVAEDQLRRFARQTGDGSVGFVAGALGLAITGLNDIFSARGVFVVSALGAAAANAVLPAADGRLFPAVCLRIALGVLLAGVYPTGVKLMTGWFREGRGFAIGTLVGALTLGSALPHLIAAQGAAVLHWQSVIAATSVGAVLSAAIVAVFVRPGPFDAPAAALDLRWALRALGDPPLRFANLGYFGHMWELYAMWTWIPAFFLASFHAWAASGGTVGDVMRPDGYSPAGHDISVGQLGGGDPRHPTGGLRGRLEHTEPTGIPHVPASEL